MIRVKNCYQKVKILIFVIIKNLDFHDRLVIHEDMSENNAMDNLRNCLQPTSGPIDLDFNTSDANGTD